MHPLNIRSKALTIPLILIGLLAGIYLLILLGGFLSHFSQVFGILLTAWLISFIVSPIVGYLKRQGVESTMAIIISFCFLFLVIILIGIYIIPSLYTQLSAVAFKLSQINLTDVLANLELKLHLHDITVSNTFLTNINGFLNFVLNNSVQFLGNVFGILFDLVLAFFFAFYMLQEGSKVKEFFYMLIPEQYRSDYLVVTKSINDSFHGFIKGQSLIALIIAIATMIVMRFLGLDFILVSGLYVFIAMLFPIIGPVICFIVPLIIAATYSFSIFIALAIVLFVISQIVINIIQPKIFAKSLGIHPVFVVLSVLIGAELFGVVGALLALPIASVVQSLFVYFYKKHATY